MHFKEKFIPRVRISNVKEINISADELVQKLLHLSETETVCFLDSCGVNHLNSHLLIAGIEPLKVLELSSDDTETTLNLFDENLNKNNASIFTISYDFGLKLENISSTNKKPTSTIEPDIFLANFDCLIIHDYQTKKTYIDGNKKKSAKITEKLITTKAKTYCNNPIEKTLISSNFTKNQYIKKIKEIQELIRKGETYQTNLTQQFKAIIDNKLTPQDIFWNLRNEHPAPFASFIKRNKDYVVSISPERFVHIEFPEIKTSPIKGTRPRGFNNKQDIALKNELLNSKKDRAENTMIVDLLRNDIGRICEFGSVSVEKLCDLEEHPSLFHLVSTVSGKLRNDINFTEIIQAIFPCGSITGCPKISTMKIIENLETVNRGLSMGAIGYCGFDKSFDLNVAIRTMTIRNNEATFNVGGGIVIDSDPLDEYEESLTKAKAIFKSIGVEKY